MAADVVISAEGLGKKYSIGNRFERERVPTLRDAVSRAAGKLARISGEAARGRFFISNPEEEDFWALRDVSFEIRRGDVVGVIGRNGAGKSTLLKVLSRITEPTEGRVEIRGRIASLLEVGTGFHPELSGRENIFLNGSILGMSRREIKDKFDEIVEFAEIDQFINTPVKRYSSGMYVRLAFSVAAHLEPEILIVDEVLAVGDFEFQKKCLGKMKNISEGGRTVLFVSHNTAALNTLTQSCIYLEKGKLVDAGDTPDIVDRYLASRRGGSSDFSRDYSSEAIRTPKLEFARVKTISGTSTHRFGDPITFIFGIRAASPRSDACFSFHVRNQQLVSVLHCYHYAPDFQIKVKGLTILECHMKKPRLNVGAYSLETFLSSPPGGALWDTVEDICSFSVVRTDSNPYWGWRSDACTYYEDYAWISQIEGE